VSNLVYLNGQFVPYEQASLPIEDRSFLFADGVYEVVRVYGGRPFLMAEHNQRLARSAAAIKLPPIDLAEIERACLHLIAANGIEDGTVYIQVSRGSYTPRNHAFPKEIKPFVLALARPYKVNEQNWTNGVTAHLVPDQRWARCDIKSVALLPNILAKQAAVEVGAYEAILVKDGFAIEGSSSNFMAVLDGEIRTFPKSHLILGGITRDYILALARELGYTVREEGVLVEDLPRCTEAWVTSTTAELMPIVQIDEIQIGDGKPGPIGQAILQVMKERIASFVNR
jgi:D-alanine transaminase